MAVVSISRIQIRRGRKTELPQLASGEFGWSVDSQELYIGNGSVAEGAPFVGNTKLLSEKDNLFQFADTYAYRSSDGFIQTGNSINNPVLRTLQDRLDDIVSVRSFGATGDGSDQTQNLQRAIDQLYLNSANKGTPSSRVILHLEPGQYLITQPLRVPPFATIRGAGSDKTIINATDTVAFITVNEESVPGTYAVDAISTYLNQARNIEISGLTINSTSTDGMQIVTCRDSVFKDLKLTGTWVFGFALRQNAGIKLTSLSTDVTCRDNVFEDIYIDGFCDSVYSDFDIKYNTFNDCTFDTADTGFYFGHSTIIGTNGQATGPNYNTIHNCTFDNIYREGVNIQQGFYNEVIHNKFINVGNYGGSYGNAQTSNITVAKPMNKIEQNYFKRTEELGFNPNFLVNYPFKSEISGPAFAKLGYLYKVTIGEAGTNTKVFNLAADADKSYIVEYKYKSNSVTAMRTGTIEIVVDPANNDVQLVDEYTYSGDNAFKEALEFNATLFDENGDTVVDTVALMMLNSTSGDNADFTYTINVKS